MHSSNRSRPVLAAALLLMLSAPAWAQQSGMQLLQVRSAGPPPPPIMLDVTLVSLCQTLLAFFRPMVTTMPSPTIVHGFLPVWPSWPPLQPPPAARPVPASRRPRPPALASRIARVARATVGRFRYAAATRRGRRGCAQVVSTILERAGATARVRLRVLDTLRDLRARNWRDIRPPPYRNGDVITWKTYDRNGDGRKDPDTHIGVLVIEANTVYVVHNSSRRRRVVKQPLRSIRYPVTRVMREGGARAS